MAESTPHDEPTFDRRTAAHPHLRAVEQLAEDTGRTMDDMERLTSTQLFELARQQYGAALPEFWRVWQDWHGDDPVQPMGDL